MTAQPPIRPATAGDVETIKTIAVDANMFTVDDVGFFDELLLGFFDGTMAEHQWLVIEEDQSRVIAAANYAPEPFSDRMGNLYFIAVAPDMQGRGFGGSLIEHIEDELRNRGDHVARVLVVETSSTDQYERTRTFYRNHGYDEEARIRQFYGPKDDKIVFWKSLAGTA